MFITICIAVLILIILIALVRSPIIIIGQWRTFLDGIQISTIEFYQAVKAGLYERQITDVTITEKSFLERHVFSAKRVYLRIAQNEYRIYVCAAPYGTGTFVSTWLCVKDETVLNRIPLLSKLAGKDRKSKTFYQLDTEAMFRLAVHTTVLDVVNTIGEAKGFRGLTELERQFNEVR